MDFEKQQNGNVVYNDETGKFTFLNMGVYVGHRTRDWYAPVPDCWKLMFYDENKTENSIHIEALVDDQGNYSRIIVMQDKFTRVLFMNKFTIEQDIIYEEDSVNPIFSSKSYISFEDNYREKVHPQINVYLSNKQQFKSDTGEVYDGDITNNAYIINFINSDINLSKLIAEDNKKRRSSR